MQDKTNDLSSEIHSCHQDILHLTLDNEELHAEYDRESIIFSRELNAFLFGLFDPINKEALRVILLCVHVDFLKLYQEKQKESEQSASELARFLKLHGSFDDLKNKVSTYDYQLYPANKQFADLETAIRKIDKNLNDLKVKLKSVEDFNARAVSLGKPELKSDSMHYFFSSNVIVDFFRYVFNAHYRTGVSLRDKFFKNGDNVLELQNSVISLDKMKNIYTRQLTGPSTRLKALRSLSNQANEVLKKAKSLESKCKSHHEIVQEVVAEMKFYFEAERSYSQLEVNLTKELPERLKSRRRQARSARDQIEENKKEIKRLQHIMAELMQKQTRPKPQAKKL